MRLFVLCGSLLLLVPQPGEGHEYNYDNLLVAWMKLDKDFEYKRDYVDSYMRLYHPKVWETVRNNEFLLEEKRMETQAEMKAAVKAFDLKDTFLLKPVVTLGPYNFDKKAFPVREM